MRTNQLKARVETFEDQYDEAMIDDLKEVINNLLDDQSVDDIDLDEIYVEMQAWDSKRPTMWDWCFDQVQSELDDIGDQKYQAYKDER